MIPTAIKAETWILQGANLSILDEVNRTPIDATLLVEANAAHAALPEKDRQDETATGLIFIKLLASKSYSGKQRRALSLAIQFRLEALDRLQMHKHTEFDAWTLPNREEGVLFLSQELFEAAAQEPLIEIDGEAHFNKESFLERLLALSEGRGSA